MGELLQRQMRVGFLLQPNSANTPATGNPVGVFTSGDRWDNPQGTAAGYFEILATVGSIVPNANVENYTLNSVGSNTMFKEQDRAKSNSKSQLKVVDLEMYATPKVAVGFLGAALQDIKNIIPTTIAGQYILPKDDTIDFQSEGFLLTVAGSGINTGVGNTDGFILSNALINTLSIKFPNVAGGEERLAKITCQVMGISLDEGQYLTGTWTPAESYVYNQSDADDDSFTLDLTIGSNVYSELCWRNVELSINNNITSDCFTASGASNMKRANPEITAVIDIPHTDATVDTFKQYKDGDLVSFTFANGYTFSDAGDNHFEIKVDVAQLTDNPRSTEGDYIAQKLSMDVLRPTAGWGDYLIRIGDAYTWATVPDA